MDISVVLLALCSAALFGLGMVLTAIGLRTLSPLRGACISVPTTALMFMAASPFALDLSAFNPRSALLFLLAGLLFPAVVTLLTFESNRRIGPHVTGALGNLTPLFAVLMAFVVLGETPRLGQLAAIAVILAGVALLIRTPSALPPGGAGWALALPLTAVIIRGTVQPVVKLGLETWPSAFAAVLIGYLVSATVLLALGSIREGRAITQFTGHRWAMFMGVGAANGMAMFTMYAALARGPVAVVAPLIACYPLATLAFGRLLFGDTGLGWRVGVALGITVAGVGLLLRA